MIFFFTANSNVAENLFEKHCQDEEALGVFCPSQSSLPGQGNAYILLQLLGLMCTVLK